MGKGGFCCRPSSGHDTGDHLLPPVPHPLLDHSALICERTPSSQSALVWLEDHWLAACAGRPSTAVHIRSPRVPLATLKCLLRERLCLRLNHGTHSCFANANPFSYKNLLRYVCGPPTLELQRNNATLQTGEVQISATTPETEQETGGRMATAADKNVCKPGDLESLLPRALFVQPMQVL